VIKPLLKDDAFLADVLSVRDTRSDALHVWWVGQSGFLLQWRGRHALIDPYLSDSLTHKYAQSAKPHVRMTERVIDPQRLDFIDVATSSHNHTDHLDAQTLRPLMRVNPDLKLIIPEANRAFVAERLQAPIDWSIGLDDGGSASVEPFTFHAVPAAHETVERDEQDRCRFLGYVIQCGQWTVFHSGDTLLYDGMVQRLRRWRIDLAILPINGRDSARGVAGNLDGVQAAQLASQIAAKHVVPCHFEMFEFNTASPEAFVAEATRLNQPYAVLRAGERLTLQG
jgi:L-ascorbate metabolism protein UlaG (beta-lactamase superfamily)